MDVKLLLTSFATVFIAELGDKTQLATLGLASTSGARWSVFLGASLALVASSALAILGADVIGRWVEPRVIRRAAAALFVALGVWMLARG